MRIIDGHCHVGDGVYRQYSLQQLLADMDSNHIEKAVICPMDKYISVYNEEGNEYTLSCVNKYPDRFAAMAVANPWYGDKAVDCAKKYLDKGFVGLKFQPAYQGFQIQDDIIFPLCELAQEYRVPVYTNASISFAGTPLQLKQLALFFPKVTFIMGHSGAWDYAYDVGSAMKNVYNIMLDISHNLSTAIRNHIQTFGPEKLIYCSNAPRMTQKHELEKLYLACEDKTALQKILFENMAALLGGSK